MSIRVEELEKMKFSDVANTKAGLLPPIHPGESLLKDFMEPLQLSANALASALHVPTNRITAIVNGDRGITADTAIRLARYFGTTEEFWLGLQLDYDLRIAKRMGSGNDVMPRAALINQCLMLY